MKTDKKYELLRGDSWTRAPALLWSRVGHRNWRAYWNDIMVGGYCAEPFENLEGIYMIFGNTKFSTVIRTEAEARAAIESKFQEWLTHAFECRKATPDGDDGVKAQIAGCRWCTGRGFSFNSDGEHVDCFHCREMRDLLAADAKEPT